MPIEVTVPREATNLRYAIELSHTILQFIKILTHLKVGNPIGAVVEVLRFDHINDRNQDARARLFDALQQWFQPLVHALTVRVQEYEDVRLGESGSGQPCPNQTNSVIKKKIILFSETHL